MMAAPLTFLKVGVGTDLSQFESGMAKVQGQTAGFGGMVSAGLLVGAAAVTAFGVHAVHAAADFQTSMAHIVNDAGESRSAIAMMSAETLRMAGEVGVAPLKLADALYFVESAGFHGAAALSVLRTSAIAAKVSGADLTSVADITTSALNAYGLASTSAAKVTDVMLQTVAEGKMKFQDLALALPTVLPSAAALRVSLPEVGAALATMTMQGDHASDASTHLRMLMMMLVAPTTMASKSLKALGLNADEATKHNVVASAALKSIHLSASELAASMSAGGPHALINTLTLLNQHLDKTFPNANDPRREAMLKSILSLKGMQAALELTGTHLSQLKTNEDGMATASTGAGKTMEGWADIQGQFNQKMDVLKAKLDVVTIQIGTKLLPVVTTVAGWLGDHLVPAVQAVGDHMDIIKPIALALVGTFVAWKTVMATMAIADFIGLVVGLGKAFFATAIQEGILNAIMALNPMGAIVIAVAVLIAGLALLVTHWQDVSNWVGTVWNQFSSLGWVKGILDAFQWIIDKVSTLVGWIQGAVTWFGNLFGAANHAPSNVKVSAAGSAWSGTQTTGGMGNVSPAGTGSLGMGSPSSGGGMVNFQSHDYGTSVAAYTGLHYLQQGEVVSQRSQGGPTILPVVYAALPPSREQLVDLSERLRRLDFAQAPAR